MKKQFASILAFAGVSLSAALVLAYPALNDKASFKGIYQAAAGGSIEFTQTIQLMAFNPATNKYTMKADVSVNGQTRSQVQDIDASELLTSEKVAQILINCAAMGGRPEVVTVTSGTFNSCAVSLDRGGMIWIADVTFGFLKEDFIDTEGNRTMVESLSFQNGK